MKANRSGLWMAGLLAVMLVTVFGCAKKSTEAPPTPPPAPAQTETPPTPPPPPPAPPTPPTPPTPVIGSGDFQPAFFDFDSYALRDDARQALDQNARLLRDNTGVMITIEGHCDERGTAEYNQALGERRAQAAREYLVQAGIDGGRIQTISYGKERPFDPGHDEAAWAQNRRAHFVVR
jgi:peptidoglycan-associated lipoprotein